MYNRLILFAITFFQEIILVTLSYRFFWGFCVNWVTMHCNLINIHTFFFSLQHICRVKHHMLKGIFPDMITLHIWPWTNYLKKGDVKIRFIIYRFN